MQYYMTGDKADCYLRRLSQRSWRDSIPRFCQFPRSGGVAIIEFEVGGQFRLQSGTLSRDGVQIDRGEQDKDKASRLEKEISQDVELLSI